MEKTNFVQIPCIDEILVSETRTHISLINKANKRLCMYNMGKKYEFCDGECAIEMEFYDGVAIAIDGCGLYMTYPNLKEVSKSTAMQERIEDYIGIYDGTITQHGIALCYGVLKFNRWAGSFLTLRR